ncbi:MAG: methylated-DNA--[protein]-cysteine S-methyltransferase [Candidatus Aminicenantes bacterium]|nr:methylated-DNA--[protein]-cysteine S-methyltransferase [Candidatus Aminicenantes bacterium]
MRVLDKSAKLRPDHIPGKAERAWYDALLHRDSNYDGVVYYGIATTGIFCRPVCTARKPKPENVRYFASAKGAIDAGFRPCKICDPLGGPESNPLAYQELVRIVQAGGGDGERLRDAELRARGLDPDAVRRWCKRRFGMTFQALSRSARLARAFDAIRCGATVTDAALSSGYESLSGFGEASRTTVGASPREAARIGAIWISRIGTPLGPMLAGSFGEALCLLEFADRRGLETEIGDLERLLKAPARPGRVPLHETVEGQLAEYFAGERREFDVPLLTPGTDFQRTVWNALRNIPYGQTVHYGGQASAIGRPRAVRDVARDNGQNRISIIVPCHRVIGAAGSLVGYGGGLPRKKALLDLEAGKRALRIP